MWSQPKYNSPVNLVLFTRFNRMAIDNNYLCCTQRFLWQWCNQQFPWCSGYHIRLTRERSPVRARAETPMIFALLVCIPPKVSGPHNPCIKDLQISCIWIWVFKASFTMKLLQKNSLWVGFEPTREDPIGFQVQRLNHSAITALWYDVKPSIMFIINATEFIHTFFKETNLPFAKRSTRGLKFHRHSHWNIFGDCCDDHIVIQF